MNEERIRNCDIPEEIKNICRSCESNIHCQNKGCAFRSLGNEYCDYVENATRKYLDLQKKAELGEHYKHLYSEVKKQKDDVVELIIKLYQKEYNKTSDWWLQEELCNNFDDMNIFTDFELERMLGEIDETDNLQ